MAASNNEILSNLTAVFQQVLLSQNGTLQNLFYSEISKELTGTIEVLSVLTMIRKYLSSYIVQSVQIRIHHNVMSRGESENLKKGIRKNGEISGNFTWMFVFCRPKFCTKFTKFSIKKGNFNYRTPFKYICTCYSLDPLLEESNYTRVGITSFKKHN